jgi:hypothetical protein
MPFNTPPRLYPAPGTALAVQVKQGSPYVRCSSASQPGDVCESGLIAVDKEDGELTRRVLACPPSACLVYGCPGHEFDNKGGDPSPW